jgi:hypothetical protein
VSTIIVFDASPLNHFARAGELAVLRDLVANFECVTTKAVRGELRKGVTVHPEIQGALDLDWVTTVPCDELEVLYLFGEYMNRLGNLARNAGEASVLAWAEAHSTSAYIDDEVGCRSCAGCPGSSHTRSEGRQARARRRSARGRGAENGRAGLDTGECWPSEDGARALVSAACGWKLAGHHRPSAFAFAIGVSDQRPVSCSRGTQGFSFGAMAATAPA